MKKLLLSIALISALLGAVPSARAIAYISWANNPDSNNMSVLSSWVGTILPNSSASYCPQFGPPAGSIVQPFLNVDQTYYQLAFTAGGYNLSANTGAELTLLSVAGNAAVNDASTSGSNLVSAPIILGAAAGSVQGFSSVSALAITGQISSTNAVTVTKAGTGAVFFMGQNTYAGPTTISGSGPLVINSIGNVGDGASSLGAPTTTTNGTISWTNGGYGYMGILRYVGGTTTTDRIIDYAVTPTGPNAFALDASGFGALTWTGNMVTSAAGSSTYAKNFWLTGVSSANNTFAGAIQDSSSGTNFATQVIKNGTGTWVLSGNNTFTGALYVNGGTLTLDYAHGAVLNSASPLYFGQNSAGPANMRTGPDTGLYKIPSSGGTLKLIGNSSGTTQTFGNVTLFAGQNRIVIDPNGGSTTLTLGDMWTRSGGSLLMIDLPTNATLASNPGTTAGLIGAANSEGWAVVKDSDGLGFATVDVSQHVVRYTSGTALAETSNGSLNYTLTGNLTFAAGSHSLNTLDINTTGGGTLDLNATAPTAQALLFTGTGDYTISGGTLGVTDIHQYSSGTVTISSLGGLGAYIHAKGGTGTLVLGGRTGTNGLNILEGALRADNASVITAGNTLLSTGGVLELGASGNLTASLGTGVGQIQFVGDGGFSAYGGDRTVQLNNGTASIAWGATNFVPNDNALVLSGKDSNSTIDFQNGLGLGTQQHVVRVLNGSAAVDAKLSGVLSGNYGGGLIKEGAGTLSITGNSNTYIGETWVNEGTLLIDGNQSAATGAVTVAAGATLGGSGTVGGATTISGNHSPGNSPGIQTFASDLTYTAGASVNWELKSNTTVNLANPDAVFDTIVVNGDLDFAGATSLNLSFVLAANGGDVDWSNAFWSASKLGTDGWLLYDVAGTLSGFSNLSLVTIDWTDSFGTALSDVPPSGKSFSLYQDGNDIYLNYVIPEPNTWLLVALGGAAFVVLRRRKSPRI